MLHHVGMECLTIRVFALNVMRLVEHALEEILAHAKLATKDGY